MSGPLTYLACPYSHPNVTVRMSRYADANIAAAKLILAGEIVFSPISHSHPIARVGHLPLDADYWAAFNRAYLECSRKLVVLCIDGWRESVGVQAEIAIAAELDIPVAYMEPPA